MNKKYNNNYSIINMLNTYSDIKKEYGGAPSKKYNINILCNLKECNI